MTRYPVKTRWPDQNPEPGSWIGLATGPDLKTMFIIHGEMQVKWLVKMYMVFFRHFHVQKGFKIGFLGYGNRHLYFFIIWGGWNRTMTRCLVFLRPNLAKNNYGQAHWLAFFFFKAKSRAIRPRLSRSFFKVSYLSFF
jgi:hypothetical protein